jgi:charged multivesicular body protein 4
MNSLFGKGKKKETKQDNSQAAMQTLENLGAKINDLEEKIRFIENKKNNQNEVAKTKLKAGDKNGAKQALAKKKKLDEQIKQYDGAIMMMEEQKMMLENASSLKDVFKTLEESNKALKEATKGFTVEDLDRIRDDLEVNLFFIYNFNLDY